MRHRRVQGKELAFLGQDFRKASEGNSRLDGDGKVRGVVLDYFVDRRGANHRVQSGDLVAEINLCPASPGRNGDAKFRDCRHDLAELLHAIWGSHEYRLLVAD